MQKYSFFLEIESKAQRREQRCCFVVTLKSCHWSCLRQCTTCFCSVQILEPQINRKFLYRLQGKTCSKADFISSGTIRTIISLVHRSGVVDKAQSESHFVTSFVLTTNSVNH